MPVFVTGSRKWYFFVKGVKLNFWIRWVKAFVWGVKTGKYFHGGVSKMSFFCMRGSQKCHFDVNGGLKNSQKCQNFAKKTHV